MTVKPLNLYQVQVVHMHAMVKQTAGKGQGPVYQKSHMTDDAPSQELNAAISRTQHARGRFAAYVADRDAHRADKRGRVGDNASGGWPSAAVDWKRGWKLGEGGTKSAVRETYERDADREHDHDRLQGLSSSELPHAEQQLTSSLVAGRSSSHWQRRSLGKQTWIVDVRADIHDL